jgi:hypothetical protein
MTHQISQKQIKKPMDESCHGVFILSGVVEEKLELP